MKEHTLILSKIRKGVAKKEDNPVLAYAVHIATRWNIQFDVCFRTGRNIRRENLGFA